MWYNKQRQTEVSVLEKLTKIEHDFEALLQVFKELDLDNRIIRMEGKQQLEIEGQKYLRHHVFEIQADVKILKTRCSYYKKNQKVVDALRKQAGDLGYFLVKSSET